MFLSLRRRRGKTYASFSNQVPTDGVVYQRMDIKPSAGKTDQPQTGFDPPEQCHSHPQIRLDWDDPQWVNAKDETYLRQHPERELHDRPRFFWNVSNEHYRTIAFNFDGSDPDTLVRDVQKDCADPFSGENLIELVHAEGTTAVFKSFGPSDQQPEESDSQRFRLCLSMYCRLPYDPATRFSLHGQLTTPNYAVGLGDELSMIARWTSAQYDALFERSPVFVSGSEASDTALCEDPTVPIPGWIVEIRRFMPPPEWMLRSHAFSEFLPHSIRQRLGSYQNYAARSINPALRLGTLPHGQNVNLYELATLCRQRILRIPSALAIQSAILSSPRCPYAFTAMRTLNWGGHLAVGDYFAAEGFLSTTVDYGLRYTMHRVVWFLKVPAYFPALYIGGANESEILLPHGTLLKVLSKKQRTGSWPLLEFQLEVQPWLE